MKAIISTLPLCSSFLLGMAAGWNELHGSSCLDHGYSLDNLLHS